MIVSKHGVPLNRETDAKQQRAAEELQLAYKLLTHRVLLQQITREL